MIRTFHNIGQGALYTEKFDNGFTVVYDCGGQNKKAISNADILLASPHGRDSGYNIDFVKLVCPNLVIISDKSGIDTNVTDKYNKQAFGMHIFEKDDFKERKVLTTRKDGVITIEIDDRLELQVSI